MKQQQARLDPELFEYGIHTEASDIRAHVSVVNRRIDVFPTKAGVDAVERTAPPLRSAYQHGVVGRTATAETASETASGAPGKAIDDAGGRVFSPGDTE